MGIIISTVGLSYKRIRQKLHARRGDSITRNYEDAPPAQRTPQSLADEEVATEISTDGRKASGRSTGDQPGANITGNPAQPSAALEAQPEQPLGTSPSNLPAAKPPRRRRLPDGTMATDEEYMAFLDKANKDLDEAKAHGASTSKSGKIELKTQDAGIDVPAHIKDVAKDAFYISDADEPFETVALKFEKDDLPTTTEFAKLVNHPSPEDADVSVETVEHWDSRGQYKELVQAIKKAASGQVNVYKVPLQGARVEYWVLGKEKNGNLVGVKALAIES